MQAVTDMGILVHAAGGPEAMEWVELEGTAPGRGEVRIAQRAVGVNFIDIYYRTGQYAWPATPLIPGSEASGVIDEVGAGVTHLAVGDRVAYIMATGAYRTRRVVPADRVVKLPDSIAFDVAASVMLKGLTVQFLVSSCYPIKAGDTALVHAAAGGVGLLLGQWLKALGATAIGTVGSAAKVATAAANGYSHVIDNSREDFATRVVEITGSKRCEVVFDSVGKDTWRGSLKTLKPRGMFVSFGQSSGAITDFKLADLAAGGSLYASRPTLFDYIRSPEDLQARATDLFARLARGEIRVHVGERLPLREAAEAHRALASRRTIGSTVLLI